MLHARMAKMRAVTFFLEKPTARTKRNYDSENGKKFYCFIHDVKVRIRWKILGNLWIIANSLNRPQDIYHHGEFADKTFSNQHIGHISTLTNRHINTSSNYQIITFSN